MKFPRPFTLTLTLLVLAGAGFWVNQNLRRDPSALAAPFVSAAPLTNPAMSVPAAPRAIPAPAASAPLLPTGHASSPPTIGSILTSSDNPKIVLAGLTRILFDPSRPADERTEALEHLLNLSAGDSTATLLPLLRDARLTTAQCEQILDDSLNGSLAWQADANLAVLSHRKVPEEIARAREHLVFVLEVDHGDDLAQWTQAIAAAKKNWVAPH